jgi:hypothetical protein
MTTTHISMPASTAMMALISPFPESIAAIMQQNLKKELPTLFFSHPACSTLNCNHHE